MSPKNKPVPFWLFFVTLGVGLLMAVLQMAPPARWMIGGLCLMMLLWRIGKRLYWKWWLRQGNGQ